MGLRGGCLGVCVWLRKSFNLRGLYDERGFFAVSIVVRLPRLGGPFEPSLTPQIAKPVAPYLSNPASDNPAGHAGATPEPRWRCAIVPCF
jgi:hypothetical protein